MTSLAACLSGCSSAASRSRTVSTFLPRDRSWWWPTTPTGSSTASCSWRHCAATRASSANRLSSRSLPLWPFLKLAGVIPVYRAIDTVAGDGNVSAFATSHELLRRGGVVAVFPEGISHDEVTLQPLRTGAARIALEAVADGNAEELVTVAVGLVYDAKARFRSRALVRVGEPVQMAQWVNGYRRDEWATVRAVTKDLAVQLEVVSPSFSSWAQATQLSWIAALVVRGPGRIRWAMSGWPTRSMSRPAWRPDRTSVPRRCSTPLGLRDVRAGSRAARCQRRPDGGGLPPPPAPPLGCVVRPQGAGGVALRCPRGAGPCHSVSDHEAGGEAADQ